MIVKESQKKKNKQTNKQTNKTKKTKKIENGKKLIKKKYGSKNHKLSSYTFFGVLNPSRNIRFMEKIEKINLCKTF